MNDQRKTKAQLINELGKLRKQITHLDGINEGRAEEGVVVPKYAEAIQRDRQAYFHNSFDNLLEGCQILDFDLRYLYINDTAVAHGRVPREEKLGRLITEVYPGVESTEMFAALRRCLDDQTSQRMENEFHYPDGRWGWFDLRIYPVPEGVFLLSIDITERKTLEQDLEKHNAQLEGFLDERSAELLVANQQLREEIEIRAQAEKAALQMQEMYQALFDHSPLPSYIFQQKEDGYRLVDFNRPADRFTEGKVTQLIGQRVSNIFSGQQEMLDTFMRCVETKNVIEHEHTYRYKTTGKEVRQVTRLAFIPPDKILLLTEDVTERAKMEAALQKSEKQYRELVEVSKDWVWAMDLEGNHTFSNEAMYPLLGYTIEEIVGSSAFPLMHPDDQSRIQELIRKSIAENTGWQGTVIRWVHKDGSTRFFESSAQPVFSASGEITGFSGIDRDITQRAEIEAELNWMNEKLRESELHYRTLFENAPMGISLTTLDGKILEVNNKLRTMLGITSEDIQEGTIADFYMEYEERNHTIQRLQEQGKVQDFEIDLKRKDGRLIHVRLTLNFLNLSEGDVLLAVVEDISEKVKAEKEREVFIEQLRTAADLADRINRIHDPAELLEEIVDEMQKRFNLYQINIYILDGSRKELELRASSGEVRLGAHSIPLDAIPGLVPEAARSRKTIIVSDVSNEPRYQPNTFLPETRSEVVIPIEIGEEVLGVFDLQDIHSDRFSGTFLDTLSMLADQTAIALENARLFREQAKMEKALREERSFAEALVDTASLLNSTLDIAAVLDHILVSLDEILPSDSASVVIVNDELDIIRVVSSIKEGISVRERQQQPASISRYPSFMKAAERRQPFVVPNVEEDDDWIPVKGTEWIKSFAVAPILHENAVIGLLSLSSATPNFFDQVRVDQMQVFANQASIAIRNAQAYEKAHELATLEERQRLARDMHDAVSQTLFSANTIAETLPILWESDPDEVRQGLFALQRLTRGAQAEMRILLSELYPDAIIKTDLGILIRQLADGILGRTDIEVTADIEGQHIHSSDIQTAFFRIAQEVLNNVIKHSEAENLVVELVNTSSIINLRIIDDGQGFDLDEAASAGFGLDNMFSRANSVGADLKINSKPGQGTEVSLHWLKE